MNDEHPSSLTIALRLRARGLSVFPVPRPGDGRDGKTPSIKWKPYQQRVCSRAELEAWFAGPQNLAVATGAVSGVVVVDADAGDARAWVRAHCPDTPWQTETGRGWHFWYQHPGGPVTNRVHVETDAGALPLDVRGDGGFVLAPGSVHASGVRYRCRGDWHVPKARLPVFSPTWFPAPVVVVDEEVTKLERRERPTTDVVCRARAYLEAVPRPEIGGGSDQATFTAACRLVRGFALHARDAEALLWDWAGGRPGWTRDWIAVKVRSARDNGKELIGAYL